jgi:hypothetical protein
VAGKALHLADPIHRRDKWLLLARRTGGGAFFLWWVKAETPLRFDPRPGEMPVRFGLEPEQVRWLRIFDADEQSTLQ